MPAWGAEQQNEARDVLTSLMAHLNKYQQQLPHHRAINRLWEWWCAKELAHDPVTGVTRMTSLLAPHQVELFCDMFDHMTWQDLTPDTQTSEQLLSLVNLYYHYNDDSIQSIDKKPLLLFFSLRHVLRQVPWERVGEGLERHWALLLSCCLAYLTVHADNVPPLLDLDPFFAQARNYPWHLVTEKTLQELNVFQIYLIDRYRAIKPELARDATFTTRVTAVVDFIGAVFSPLLQVNHVNTHEALINHVITLQIPRIQSHTALIAAFISLPIISNAVSSHMVSHVIRSVEHVTGMLVGSAESTRVEELITTVLRVLLRVFNLTDKVSLADLILHLEAREPVWQAAALNLVRACALSIASEQKQVALIEACLEADLLLHQNWTRLQHALIVPDVRKIFAALNLPFDGDIFRSVRNYFCSTVSRAVQQLFCAPSCHKCQIECRAKWHKLTSC